MSAPAITMPSANVHEFTADLVVRRRSTPAEGVAVLDLAHPENEDLPRAEPGALIDESLMMALRASTHCAVILVSRVCGA